MRRTIRTAAILLAVSLASTSALATTLIQLNLNQLAAEADSVVVAKATGQTYETTSEGVFTVTTFSVSDAMIGNAGATISVSVPGGVRTINGRRFAETWAGAPIFPVGVESVLFLDQDAAGKSAVVGFSQGAFAVVDGPGGKAVRLPGYSKAKPLNEAKQDILAARGKANGADRLGD